MSNITIISSERNWLEQSAVEQLKQVASLPGVSKAVGLPDLHPGRTPVGCVIVTEGILYPHLIGNDIGCGMSMYLTEMECRKLKIDRYVKKAVGISRLQEIELPEEYESILQSSPLGNSLGTIGGGNHFAELQVTDAVYQNEAFSSLGLDKNQAMLLVHSGSRGYGQTILDESIRLHSAQNGLISGSSHAVGYLSKHDDAVKWAAINRDIIAHRLLRAFGANALPVKQLDSCHNSITELVTNQIGTSVFIHRKGAAPADNGVVIIPGSRGSLSYLVQPTSNPEISGYSIAHGAGRKWERTMCRSRLEHKYTKESIRTTKLKGQVICNDNRLLFEEAPEAYKDIESVIQSLQEYGLIEIIATFKPVITYKN